MSLAGGVFRTLKPLINRLSPERAHGLAIAALEVLPHSRQPHADAQLATTVSGLNFPNPLGLAAGFDKDARVPDAMLGLGFGFVEVGTLTPLPQAGNPQPRLFRLTQDRAIINRMGFNNAGHAAARHRLELRKDRGGIVAVNIGANKTSENPAPDYAAGIMAFSELASFFVVNISSPNTPGLRSLQAGDALARLMDSLETARSLAPRHPPLFLKIAPDLDEADLVPLCKLALDARVDGLVISNTTIARPKLASPHRAEAGGLSGVPLFEPSTRMLARCWHITKGRIPLIGAGGVDSAEAAWAKICAGASLVELYSALVFEGPDLVTHILAGLQQKLAAAGFSRLEEAVGSANQGVAGT